MLARHRDRQRPHLEADTGARLREPMLCSGTMTVPVSASPPVGAATEAAKPDYAESGVDFSLVRYSLSLTPTQRLKAVENFMNALASVRAAPPLSADSTK